MRANGAAFTPEETAAFIARARSCMGVRFKHQGRDPRFGLDCAGLPLWSMAAMGRPVVDIAGYGREPHKDGLERALTDNLGEPIPIEQMRAGDVILMRFGGAPRHVGILTDHPEGGLSLLHVHDRLKFVAEHRLEARTRIVKVWRP